MAGQVPDIPGILAPPHGARDILQYLAKLLNRKSPSFPGAQPVSFARRHLDEDLLKTDFFVCEKSDGLRCLLLLREESDGEKCYMITRKNEVFFIPDLHVPCAVDSFDSCHAKGSLIDGELVKTNSGKLNFLMFDMVVCNGKVVADRILDNRLGYLGETVYKPFSELCRQFPEDTSVFPFKLKMKGMQFSYGLLKVLEEKLDHISDGLIFTNRTTPYVFGTDPNILKWKPADENSVDFVLRLEFQTYTDPSSGEQWPDYDALPKVELLTWYGGDDDRVYAEMHLEEQEWTSLKAFEQPLQDRVVECYMDDKKRWRFLRFRDDKDHGNHHAVVANVRESIMDHITDEDLIKSIPIIRDAWHARSEEKKRKASGSGGSGGGNDAKRQNTGQKE